jgi:hypothetical protein
MKYKGMTINERLFASGRMEEFDSYVKKKKWDKLKKLLLNLEVDADSIERLIAENLNR